MQKQYCKKYNIYSILTLFQNENFDTLPKNLICILIITRLIKNKISNCILIFQYTNNIIKKYYNYLIF